MYINAHSTYSNQYGTLLVEELVSAAIEKGITRLALTDINTVAGLGKFVRLASGSGIIPICGVEFRNGPEIMYIVLAKNADGLAEVSNFLHYYQTAKKPFPVRPPHFDNAITIYRFNGKIPAQLRENEYVGIRPSQLKYNSEEVNRFSNKLVVRQPITFTDSKGYEAHKSMRKVTGPTPISMLLNEAVAMPDERILTEFEFSLFFSRYPQIISNTETMLSLCEEAYLEQLDCLPDAFIMPEKTGEYCHLFHLHGSYGQKLRA